MRDFLLAVRQIDAAFAKIHLMALISFDSDYTLDVFDLIKKSRHLMRLKGSREEFEPSYKGNRAREPSECICGKTD